MKRTQDYHGLVTLPFVAHQLNMTYGQAVYAMSKHRIEAVKLGNQVVLTHNDVEHLQKCIETEQG